jgi:RHS repeat-associated protein
MDDLEHSFVSTYNNTLIFEASILTANNHSIVGNTSLMHGRDYEPEIGLYYFRNRYYHPQLGRFLQQDPMGYEDSLNTYQAFGMNPVNFNDPFGKDVLGSCSSSYQHFLKPSENEEIIKKQLRSYALVAEGIANAAAKTFLLPAKYITLPARLAFGFDFDVNINFTRDGSVIGGYLGKQNRLDIVKEQTVVFPLADFVTQTSHDVYFGLFYQGGNSILGKPSRENLARTSGGLGFNLLFWGSVSKSLKVQDYYPSDSITFKGDVFRYENYQYMDTTWTIHEWNIQSSHRFSGSGKGALYSSLDAWTAFKEVRGNLGKWLTVKRAKVKGILDLTDPNIAKRYGITSPRDIATIGDYSFTQRLGNLIRSEGYKGILTPSAQNPGGVNLVLFDVKMLFNIIR